MSYYRDPRMNLFFIYLNIELIIFYSCLDFSVNIHVFAQFNNACTEVSGCLDI